MQPSRWKNALRHHTRTSEFMFAMTGGRLRAGRGRRDRRRFTPTPQASALAGLVVEQMAENG
jgi:hypothetical protein